MGISAHERIDNWLEAKEREIRTNYEEALEKIKAELASYLSQIKKKDDSKQKSLENGEITLQEYKKWRKKEILRGKKFSALKNEIASILLYYNKQSIEIILRDLEWVYIQGAEDAAEDAEIPTGATIPYADYEVDTKKAMKWNRKKVETLILAGITSGYSLDKIAKSSKKIVNANVSAVINNARTFATGAENKGRVDSYREIAKTSEAESRSQNQKVEYMKEWITVEDSHVRYAHMELHGQVCPLSEPFANTLGEIWFPGDPSALPANRHGCRCHTRIVAIGEGGEKVKIQFPRKTGRLDIDNY